MKEVIGIVFTFFTVASIIFALGVDYGAWLAGKRAKTNEPPRAIRLPHRDIDPEIDGPGYYAVRSWMAEYPSLKAVVIWAMVDGKMTQREYESIKQLRDAGEQDEKRAALIEAIDIQLGD